MEDPEITDPISELLTNYSDLNPPHITVLESEPSPLEFMRYVSRNTPFLVKSYASSWPATKSWTPSHLKSLLGSTPVNVAITPHGNADSPLALQDGTLVFVKPHEEQQPFDQFIDYLTSSSSSSLNKSSSNSDEGGEKKKEVRYAQTQNDNLRNEYASLYSQVQPDVPFARIALDNKHPEAINLWIGTGQSVTALHKDNYENVYVQISGKKHFVLLPPVCQPCVNEQMLEQAHYTRLSPSSSGSGSTIHEGDLLPVEGFEHFGLVIEENQPHIPFATWDPDSPMVNETEYSCLAKPMRVTLEPGDMLYLPAMWYHKVSQSCEEGGMSVAVNYWYDMEFAGPLYPLTTFVRSVFNREREIDSDVEEDEEER
ncbi:cupin-like domain-containing protein [Cladorrhinum sp. PSN259]|nr:cupin-like domain-containing protein [Cladorrhinum sp. PSN259]